jgi:hypothetical protein
MLELMVTAVCEWSSEQEGGAGVTEGRSFVGGAQCAGLLEVRGCDEYRGSYGQAKYDERYLNGGGKEKRTEYYFNGGGKKKQSEYYFSEEGVKYRNEKKKAAIDAAAAANGGKGYKGLGTPSKSGSYRIQAVHQQESRSRDCISSQRCRWCSAGIRQNPRSAYSAAERGLPKRLHV